MAGQRITDAQVDEYLETIEEHFADSLTPWEFDFIHSIRERWEKFHSLSDGQRIKLDEVMERCARRMS